ncbi:MAG: DUF2065 domain-containing protein [Mariprofundaceae bacterium]
MDDLWAALGLVLVLEGAFYALVPERMQEMMRQLQQVPPQVLRLAGLASVGAGWLVVWLVRG